MISIDWGFIACVMIGCEWTYVVWRIHKLEKNYGFDENFKTNHQKELERLYGTTDVKVEWNKT